MVPRVKSLVIQEIIFSSVFMTSLSFFNFSKMPILCCFKKSVQKLNVSAFNLG